MSTPVDLRVALAEHPLPPLGGDKDGRGALVLVAGGVTCPGGAVLAATAALRAGAGRVQIACHPTVAAAIGVAVPEALVIGWDGRAPLPARLVDTLASASAVLVGPGLDDSPDATGRAVAEQVAVDVPLLLDAGALRAAADVGERHLLVLPNDDEARALADRLGLDGDGAVETLGESLAQRLGGVVAVRGERTIVVGDRTYHLQGDHGLGASGSGDVVVGLAGGLAARGVADLPVVAWAVAAHARAGEILGRNRPNPGYLPRELLDVIPDAIDRLAQETGAAGHDR